MIQFVVELQRLLWLYRPILDRQALIQLLQVKDTPGFEGREYNKIKNQLTGGEPVAYLCMPG